MRYEHAAPASSRYTLGVDLGKAADFTAFALLETITEPTEEWKINPRSNVSYQQSRTRHECRFLERPPLRTPYPEIIARTCELLSRPPIAGKCALVADATGVGAPVIDSMRVAGLFPIPITITAGQKVNYAGGGYTVPKIVLVSKLTVLAQDKVLKIAPEIPETPALVKELEHFRAKVSLAGSATFEAWRERDHDDLVLALAIAAWWASRPRCETGMWNVFTGERIAS